MKVDSIHTGIVLDHIKAGRGMDVYQKLYLDELDCPVAYMRNVRSNAMGRKDIIKIDDDITIDLDVLGYIDPGITVSIVRDGKLDRKFTVELPERVVNVIKCKNPRCITSTEQELDHVFVLTEPENGVYRCIYCEAQAK